MVIERKPPKAEQRLIDYLDAMMAEKIHDRACVRCGNGIPLWERVYCSMQCKERDQEGEPLSDAEWQTLIGNIKADPQ